MVCLITVLLPTLDCEDYLLEALDSLKEQRFRKFRVLLLDGGSTDGTVDLAKRYRALPIDVVECGRVGLGAQLRMGLNLVDTPYIARMDADDISVCNRFEQQVEALSHDSHLVMVGSQIQLLIGSRICRAAHLPLHHDGIRTLLEAGFPALCHPSVMFRTSAARQCGAYSVAGLGEDLDFYLRITEIGRACNLAEVLHTYRLHANSVNLRSYEEIQQNYNYALDCAFARRKGVAEIDPDQHRIKWTKRGIVRRAATRLECAGVALYRKSRVSIAEGELVKGMLGVGVSTLMRPRVMRGRARQHLSLLRRALRVS